MEATNPNLNVDDANQTIIEQQNKPTPTPTPVPTTDTPETIPSLTPLLTTTSIAPTPTPSSIPTPINIPSTTTNIPPTTAVTTGTNNSVAAPTDIATTSTPTTNLKSVNTETATLTDALSVQHTMSPTSIATMSQKATNLVGTPPTVSSTVTNAPVNTSSVPSFGRDDTDHVTVATSTQTPTTTRATTTTLHTLHEKVSSVPSNVNTVVIEVTEKERAPRHFSSQHQADRYPFLTSSRRSLADTDYVKLAQQQGWLPHQATLFQTAVTLLEEAHLAKLTHPDKLNAQSPIDAAVITLHTSRAAEKLRVMFSEIAWDAALTPWLNQMLLDNLDRDLAEEYIDMLRHLRLKIPEIMLARGLLDGRGSRRLGGNAMLRIAIATPPDLAFEQPQQKWNSGVQPIIILAPGEHSWSSTHLKGWKDRLGALGKVITCQENATWARDTATLARNLLRKVREVKHKYPSRPIVLLGFSVGAKVAIMVSFKEKASCLVCLGLQLQGIAGNAAHAVDTRDLFQLRPPTLFAIGSQSHLCPVYLMEQVRLQMIAQNKLVIIRDADENLRIPLSKRLKVKLTQTMADQLVMHQIGSFIQDSLKRLEVDKPGKESSSKRRKTESTTH